ncbi:hypothetical protein N7462_010949 [Penicillium macrosclerotiorum]|uniref:uncharacterized protein n=1 Tax=Penicillium macrosclerotiorum TaxID=303699 RepID=UPI002548AAC4|nr:uncharacterized protein N7462_010949 [Penicillium macrosclerotiorum]KAJ5669879.1 hypothetical protein N7462_010949 [Penicillium macrosclerotiorum]
MFVVVNHTLTEEHPQDGQIPDSEEDEQENLKRGQRRLSPSLSPFGVEEWEEDQGRYRRSLSPSPDQVRALIARFALDYGPQGSGTSRCARKRKRSVSSASSLVVGPPSPASYGTLDNTKSRKRKRSVTWTSSQLDNPANQTKESTFKGLIIHKSRPQAMDFALEADRPPFRTKNTFRHIFWTDGSIIRQNAAGSVVWRSPPGFKSWDHRSFWVPFETPCTDLVEMFAISNALLLATYQVQESQSEVNSKNSQIEGGGQIQQPQLLHQVFVFTDSVGALTRIENEAQGRHSPAYCDEAHAIINYSSQLQSLGATLELHLVPGHSSVPGNERAHRVAKKAAQSLTESRGFSGPAERRHGPKPTDDQVLRPIKLADSQAISGKNSTPAIPHYDLQSIQDPALGSDDSTESIISWTPQWSADQKIRNRLS